MRGADPHAGRVPCAERLMADRETSAMIAALVAEDEASHTPGSALTRKAAQRAGALETWGPVRLAERIHIFRAVSHATPSLPREAPLVWACSASDAALAGQGVVESRACQL